MIFLPEEKASSPAYLLLCMGKMPIYGKETNHFSKYLCKNMHDWIQHVLCQLKWMFPFHYEKRSKHSVTLFLIDSVICFNWFTYSLPNKDFLFWVYNFRRDLHSTSVVIVIACHFHSRLKLVSLKIEFEDSKKNENMKPFLDLHYLSL